MSKQVTSHPIRRVEDSSKVDKFPRVRIADVCELIVDCVNKTAPIVTYETPYRMIRTTNIRDGRIDLSTARFVDQSTFEKWTRRAPLLDGDVILTREAPIGEVGLVKNLGKAFLGQRLMQYRADPKKLDSRFLLYAFRTPELRHQFGMHEGSGSVVSHIRVGDCSEFKIPLPPMHVQREIADTLGALDDKIALLRETNATLEAIAQALFKSWFVDFDPVRAKAEGRDPEGVPIEVAELFPSKFGESELGPIPKEWKVGRMGSAAMLSKQQRRPQDEPYVVFEYYSLPAFDADQMPIRELGSTIKSNKFVVPPDGILLSKLNPHIPRIWLPTLQAPEAAICSTEFLVLRPRLGISKEWLYLLSCSEFIQTRLRQLVTGTSNSHQRVKPDNLMELRVALPPESIANAFCDLAKPLLDRINTNRLEIQSLSKVRDTLLPRLLSGELQMQSQAAEIL